MAWIKAISPKAMNDYVGVYGNSIWLKEMDRCWIREEDGTCVSSRLINTRWGKVEHVTITRKALSVDGSGGFSWSEKQQIKNELFGENRDAIEVYPRTDMLIDTCDVYHLWVFDKKVSLPFGIHPKQYAKAINRGSLSLSQDDLIKLQKYYDREEGATK